MLLFLSPDIAYGEIVGNTFYDNRNAGQDGIGLGENGVTSNSSRTINNTQIVFGLDSPRAYRNGEAVTIVSRGAPFARRMVGTVQAGGGTATTTITVNVPAGGITGSGTYSDRTLNTEPGPVVIANNVVALTGLFGIDHASNFTVTGNRLSNVPQRCLDFELDYGGTMRNIVSTGNTCTDSGPGSTNVFLGNGADANGNPSPLLNISDVFISKNALIDSRVPAATYANYYFVPGTTSSTCHAFQRVVVEGACPARRRAAVVRTGPTPGGRAP